MAKARQTPSEQPMAPEMFFADPGFAQQLARIWRVAEPPP
jgi:hypothetical protein